MRVAVAIEDRPLNWKQKTWRFIKGTFILLAVAIFMIWSIFFIARFIKNAASSPRGPNVIVLSSSPPPSANNARTGIRSGSIDWGPTSPSMHSPRAPEPGAGRGPAAGAPPAVEPAPPVGISEDEYRAVVAAGGRVYIPNPKGECDLAGASAADSVRSLESCLAQRAAR